MSVTYVYTVWLILTSVTHFVKCDSFSTVYFILQSATILVSVTHVYKVWLILSSLSHFEQSDSYF